MSGDSQKLLDLAERVEKADAPDAALEMEISRAVFPHVRVGGVPMYTASLDAALTLVPEGHDIQITQASGPGRKDWYARCKSRTEYGDAPLRKSNAATGSLALCAAALRARAAI